MILSYIEHYLSGLFYIFSNLHGDGTIWIMGGVYNLLMTNKAFEPM